MKRIALLAFLSSIVVAGAIDIPLRWNAVTNADGSTFTNLSGYQVYYGFNTNSIVNPAPFYTTNSVVVSNLQPVSIIYFQIQAVLSNLLVSPLSSILTVTNTTPSTPSGFTSP